MLYSSIVDVDTIFTQYLYKKQKVFKILMIWEGIGTL